MHRSQNYAAWMGYVCGVGGADFLVTFMLVHVSKMCLYIEIFNITLKESDYGTKITCTDVSKKVM